MTALYFPRRGGERTQGHKTGWHILPYVNSTSTLERSQSRYTVSMNATNAESVINTLSRPFPRDPLPLLARRARERSSTFLFLSPAISCGLLHAARAARSCALSCRAIFHSSRHLAARVRSVVIASNNVRTQENRYAELR